MTPIFGPREPLAMTFALQLLSKLTIGRKLALIGVLFALPLAFLLYSVIAEKNIAIDFARKEISGNHFLTALTNAQMALQRSTAARLDEIAGVAATAAGPAASNEDAAQAIDGITSAAKELTDVPLDPALAAAVVDAARAFLAKARSLDTDQLVAQHSKLVAKLRELVARVGDPSNLILDPGLDSVYIMDARVVTLPDLADRLMDLSVLTAAIAEKKTLSVEDRAQFMILMGQFESAREELSKAIDTAYRGNPDGRLKAGLDADYRAAAATLTFLAAGMKGHVLERDGLPVDAHAAAQLRDAGLTVIDRLTNKGQPSWHQIPWIKYFNLRNWDKELAAPLRDVTPLSDDFVLQVPRQNKQIIRLGHIDGLDRIDRYMHSRCKAAVFVGVFVHREVEKIRANAAVVEQGIALAGSTIATNPRPLVLALNQEGEELALGSMNLCGKARINFDLLKTNFALVSK